MLINQKNVIVLFMSFTFIFKISFTNILNRNLDILQIYNCTHLNKSIKIIEKDIFASRYIFKHQNDSIKECLKLCCLTDLCNSVHYLEHTCLGMNIPAMFFLSFIESQSRHHWKKNLLQKKHNVIPRAALPSQNRMPVSCEPELHSCPFNEYCKVTSMEDTGICSCVAGTSRNLKDVCVIIPGKESSIIPTPRLLQPNQLVTEIPNKSIGSLQGEMVQSTTVAALESSEAPRQLIVTVNSKKIELKTGEDMYKSWATLSAYAIGDVNSNCTYKWTLISKPKNDEKGSVKDVNKQTVSLLNLVVGVYQFKVEVSGPNAFGEAVGNITIDPAKHRNKPPIAKISPANMTVRLPNSAVILDGSESSDDDEITSFHWEIVMGPIAYKLASVNGRTLELKDLLAGNYTIMLEVEDEAGQKDTAIATLSVVKETDYPPTANAGGDKVIYLPMDKIVLNGNLSSDDHGIKEWEWTKGPEDSGNAVDMQFTRKSTLQLSNLEEGHYHFILKVVDTSDQTATSEVHVYVHSPLDSIPVANAGNNLTLTIPVTSTVLDGTGSTDVSITTNYLWKQLSGPKMATLTSNNSAQVNVTGLTKGTSIFQLTLWNGDDSAKNSSSNVTVVVVQVKNVPPVADAGQDFKIRLPMSAVVINGSLSKDDVAITKWLWKRDDRSLAAGNVIESSSKSPILIMTNIIPGRYVWNLTVWDDQGASSSDTVSFIVENPPYFMNEVEIVVGVGIERLSVAQKENCIQKLQVLYSSAENDDVILQIVEIRGVPLSGKSSLIVIGRRGKDVVSGSTLAHQIRNKVMNPSNPRLLDLPIIAIDTIVCQNNCSGHGECNKATRQCRCNSWWMESIFRKYFGDSITNCDWSVVYVFVGALGSTLVTGIIIWLLVSYGSQLRNKRSVPRNRNPQYLLLDNQDDVRSAPPRNLTDSDSDSGSDILFDGRNARGSNNEKRTNGYINLQRIRS